MCWLLFSMQLQWKWNGAIKPDLKKTHKSDVRIIIQKFWSHTEALGDGPIFF